MNLRAFRNLLRDDFALRIYRDELKDEKYRPVNAEQISQWSQQALQGDISAKHRIVETNLRLVVMIALDGSTDNCSRLDLIQEGNLGLIGAVERFDSKRGIKLSTYARDWILCRCRRFVYKHGRNVRVPVYAHEAARSYSDNLDDFRNKLGRTPTRAEFEEKIQVGQIRWLAILTVLQNERSLDYEFFDISDDDQAQNVHEVTADQSTLSPSSRLLAKERLTEMYSEWWRFNTLLEHLRTEGPEKIRRFELKAGLIGSNGPTTFESVARTCNPLVTRQAIEICVSRIWIRLANLGSPYQDENSLIEAEIRFHNLRDMFESDAEIRAIKTEARKAYNRWHLEFAETHPK